MPYLVNGCGTHYYGKKNIQKRPGPCPHCGRAVELMSYDTRKWFVIVLIPIVPLGRLRIVDYCTACTRHYAMGADKWDAARQLEVSGAMEKYRANPTPEAAMEAHQQLLNFHQLEDATAFRKLMREKYADNAKVHAYLGAALERFGQLDEARGCYQRAYELRPDLPEARIGVARGHIQAGKLTEARALLDFMEKPGAAQLYSLEPIDTLARAFQGAERHDDALALFTIIQRELPHLNEQRWFRDLIRKSEKALKRSESLLPKQSFSWKRFFAPGNASTARTLIVCGVIISLIAFGFIIVNEYVRRNRTVRFVNAYRQQATVQLSGRRQPIFVEGVSEVTLSEGDYHATITGPVQQEVDFSIRESYWSRWFGDPAWVLNIGGAAILEFSHVTYAKNDPPPPQYMFFYGETFHRFPDVEYAFRELPEKLEVSSGGTRQVTHLDIFAEEPLTLVYYFVTQKDHAEAFRLAEWQLQKQPEDEKMVALYAQTAASAKQVPRAEKFLRAGLTNRPVRVQWHRFYQNLRRDEQRDAELTAQYRAELVTDPTNSALMYLLGRVVPTRAESRLWFERACAADTNNAFAFYASAYDRCSVGDWSRARGFLVHACALQPDQFEFSHQLGRVRFALGEYAELEKELRKELTAHPLSFDDCRQLCEVLVAQGKPQEAVTYADNFRRRATSEGGARVAASNRELECDVLYLTGDFEKLRERTAGKNDDLSKYQCFIAQIETGHAREAIKLLPSEENTAGNPFHFLNTAIALRATGETAEATRWQELGLAALEKGDADWKRAAGWLRSSAPKFAGHEEFSLPAESKVTVLTALAQTNPALRGELLPLIAKLNVLPGYPQHLIQTVTAQMK